VGSGAGSTRRRARGVELGEAMRAATEAMWASRAREVEELLADEE
jgi:hypothetical protein